jgi:hypothetical protein
MNHQGLKQFSFYVKAKAINKLQTKTRRTIGRMNKWDCIKLKNVFFCTEKAIVTRLRRLPT